MNQKSPFVYKFGSFCLDPSDRTLYHNNKIVPLSSVPSKLLLILVESDGGLLEHDDLINKVWGEYAPIEPNNLSVQITALRKALKKDGTKYIANVPRRGYRFLAKVKKVPRTEITTPTQPTQETLSDDQNSGQEISNEIVINDTILATTVITSTELYHLDKSHLLIGSVLYGLMYAVGVILEISFRFDEHGQMTLPLAAFLFLWIAATSAICLHFDWKLTLENKKTGLGFPAAVFFTAAALAFIVAALFLPKQPITIPLLSTIAAQTAQGAFFKNAFIYFLPPALFFWVLPFHCVAALRRDVNEGKWHETRKLLFSKPDSVSPKGAVYFKPRTFGLIFLLIIVFTLFLTYNLLEKIKPDAPYSNLFTLLVFARLILCYSLVIWCLYWYEQQLNRIKEECKTFVKNEPEQSVNVNVASDKIEQFVFWKAVVILSLVGNIILAAIVLYPKTLNKSKTPRIDNMKILTPRILGKEFYVRLDGSGFDPETVHLKVVGDGCPSRRPCEVPTGALYLHGEVTEVKIEKAPLTLGVGDYQIAVQNGDKDLISNFIIIPVNAH